MSGSNPQIRLGRKWYARKRTWVAAALVAFLVWRWVPARYVADGIEFTVHRSGAPMTITFNVRDAQGKPLPGVTAMSESFSGTTEEVVTDAAGVATIQPGESEVLAVYIQRREFDLTRGGIFEHFAPTCTDGLTLTVTVNGTRLLIPLVNRPSAEEL